MAAAGFGTLGALSRFAADAGLSTIAFVTWRSLMGATILAAAILGAAAIGRVRLVAPRDVPRQHWLQVMSVACMSLLTNLAVFAAFERTTIALVLIAFYTYPVLVAVAAVRVYGDPLTLGRVVALAMASAGMVLVVVAPALDEGGVQVDPLGLVLGLAASAFQTVYALIAGRGYPSLPAAQAATAIAAAAALGLVLITVVSGSVSDLLEPLSTDGAWMPIVLAATVGLAIPTAAVIAGYRRVGPTSASILMLFEPVVGVLLAALLVSERPSPLQLVGGLLVLGGGALVHVGRPAPRGLGEGVPSV